MKIEGRTSQQIMGLKKGAVYVVHSDQMKRYVEVLISDLRSYSFRQGIRVITVADRYSIMTLDGSRGLIHVDHDVQAHVPVDVWERIMSAKKSREQVFENLGHSDED